MANQNTIDRCLLMLSTHYPFHAKANGIDGATIARQVYSIEWADVDNDLLLAAVLQWLSTPHPYHPQAGEIRLLAYQLITQLPSAEEAWLEVKRQIKENHIYRPRTFSNGLIQLAAEAIGWEALCIQTMSDEPANRAHFMRLYEAFQRRVSEEALMLPDVKVTVAELRQRAEAQQLIGDTAKALASPERLKRLTGGKP
jgi:hypothetical protein